MTDEDKLQYLKENTFVDRYSTVSKDQVVVYTLRQVFPKNKKFCLVGDATFDVDAAKAALVHEEFLLDECAAGVVKVRFREVFEPEKDLYSFKFMVWNGPLTSSSQQCTVRIVDFSKQNNIECKILWVS